RPGTASTALDPLHVVVAEAEMVTDLMDQDMPHQRGEAFSGLAPIIEDGSTVEKHHVGLGSRVGDALLRQRDTAIKPQNIEGAFELHLLLGLGIGKFLDTQDQRSE